MTKVTLIVPAAGTGTRMKQAIPKTMLPIHGQPILYWTLKRWVEISEVKQILLPIGDSIRQEVQQIVAQILQEVNRDDISFHLVEGGSERIYSINNCIPYIASDSSLIAVHDAVRPFFDKTKVLQCFEDANTHGAAILGLPLRETIKEISSDRTVINTPQRSKFWSIQTPQCFTKSIFIRSYENAISQNYVGTDDASLVEFAGFPVQLTEGNDENIKITYPIDLEIAEILIKKLID